MDINSKNGGDLALQSQPQATVKQEKLEPVESTNENSDLIPDSQSYILQQQQLQYETDFQYKELKESNADSMANVSENSDEPIAKRPRRRRQATKPVPPESLDSSDNDNDAGDSMLEMTVTKTEEESESDGDENVDDPEPAKYGSAGDDTEQPGPSGLGKGGTDAPKTRSKKAKDNDPEYKLKASYKNDRKSKKRKSTWSCKNCGLKFENRRAMLDHRTEIHIEPYETMQRKYNHDKIKGIYSCKNCDFETSNNEFIQEHILKHEQKFECQDCKECFYSAYKFAVHVRKHADEEIYKCPLCNYSTIRRTSILIHINTIHLQKYLYYCQFCGKGFHDAVTFKEHENIHQGAKPISCIVCQKEFSYTRNLVLHQTRYHRVTIMGVELKNQCPICKKIFSRPNTLECHIKIHDKTKPKPKVYLCDTCGKGFSQKNKLTTHYRVHTGDKPYKCSYCVKSFTKKDYLTMHERIHSGEKPYCCTFCGKRFNQDASLRIHVRGHTGERPYVCQFCSNGYVSKAALKMHLNNCRGQ